MRELIAWAEDHPDLKLLQLSVHANNPRARHLYASLGFEIEGRRRGGIRIGDEFVDEIVMSRWLGEDESPELISGHNRVATK
jgi:RimJ/RimL family protein N-acetyltransferase